MSTTNEPLKLSTEHRLRLENANLNLRLAQSQLSLAAAAQDALVATLAKELGLDDRTTFNLQDGTATPGPAAPPVTP